MLDKLKVLLIEDNDEDAEFMQIILGRLDRPRFDIVRVSLLSEGLARLEQGDIELVICDLSLPDCRRGLDSFKQVHAKAPRIPIVVLTGIDDETLVGNALHQGAQDYIVKGNMDSDLLSRSLRYAVERKQAEENLRRAQDELVQAGKLAVLGQIAAGISHELNQPLEAIQAYIDNTVILLKEKRYEEVKSNFQAISSLTRRAGTIIKHIKAMAQKKSLTAKPVCVQTSISSTLSFLQLGRKLEGVDIIQNLPGEEIFIMGDPVQLEQVIFNLLSNAIDAMSGCPVKRIILDLKSSSDNVVLKVRDFGTGFSGDILPRIFDPFFTTKAESKGIGLGLSISLTIIKEFGGTMLPSNHPDGGAELTINFPRAKLQK